MNVLIFDFSPAVVSLIKGAVYPLPRCSHQFAVCAKNCTSAIAWILVTFEVFSSQYFTFFCNKKDFDMLRIVFLYSSIFSKKIAIFKSGQTYFIGSLRLQIV